jgi:DNA-directed RNA polymerase I, II, and III subunit RPABC2
MLEKYLTKFETTRILGARATQIAQGAPIYVDIGNLTDALEIAKKELIEKKIPLKVIRSFPDGTIKEIPVCDLEIHDCYKE